MSEASSVRIELLFPSPALANEIVSGAAIEADSEIAGAIADLGADVIKQDGRKIIIDIQEAPGGVEENGSIDTLMTIAEQSEVAYAIEDSGNMYWEPVTVSWRPGMPKRATIEISDKGKVVLEAERVIAVLEDYPEALAALEREFQLDGLDL